MQPDYSPSPAQRFLALVILHRGRALLPASVGPVTDHLAPVFALKEVAELALTEWTRTNSLIAGNLDTRPRVALQAVEPGPVLPCVDQSGLLHALEQLDESIHEDGPDAALVGHDVQDVLEQTRAYAAEVELRAAFGTLVLARRALWCSPCRDLTVDPVSRDCQECGIAWDLS